MKNEESISLQTFRAALELGYLNILKTIYLAMVGGVLMFILVFLFLVPRGEGWSEADQTLANLMSLVHIVALFSALSLSGFLFTRLYTAGMRKAAIDSVPDVRAWQAIQSSHLVRLALLEGAAMLGLVTCFLAGQNGLLNDYPVYWLNLLSSLIFIGYAIINLPSDASLEAEFRFHHPDA